jgi:N-acetylneuraminic acid mutarotase
MNYARHGHSCCTILDRYIIVSGSRKEVNNAANRVELYDANIDEWLELPRINEGRHYHSSCHFNHKFVFVFGGIQNSNKKYSASIEKFHFDLDGLSSRSWERVNISKSIMQ